MRCTRVVSAVTKISMRSIMDGVLCFPLARFLPDSGEEALPGPTRSEGHSSDPSAGLVSGRWVLFCLQVEVPHDLAPAGVLFLEKGGVLLGCVGDDFEAHLQK